MSPRSAVPYLRILASSSCTSLTVASPTLAVYLAITGAIFSRRVVLELPGFLGLGAIVASTDLVATLPRQIGETLAASAGLAVHACPVSVPPFTVKQHWHARAHQDGANRWLRGVVAALFLRAGHRNARR